MSFNISARDEGLGQIGVVVGFELLKANGMTKSLPEIVAAVKATSAPLSGETKKNGCDNSYHCTRWVVSSQHAKSRLFERVARGQYALTQKGADLLTSNAKEFADTIAKDYRQWDIDLKSASLKKKALAKLSPSEQRALGIAP